jgi:uncharacterized protein YprB with RNaseH-like and TPR domain
LPNFRLQTLERYICGRQRNGDIPGHEIPAAYHDYVRGGNLAAVEAILHHNALDLVTLLQMTLVFLEEGKSRSERDRKGNAEQRSIRRSPGPKGTIVSELSPEQMP